MYLDCNLAKHAFSSETPCTSVIYGLVTADQLLEMGVQEVDELQICTYIGHVLHVNTSQCSDTFILVSAAVEPMMTQKIVYTLELCSVLLDCLKFIAFTA